MRVFTSGVSVPAILDGLHTDSPAAGFLDAANWRGVALAGALIAAAAGAAHAQSESDDKSPWAVFKFGFSAYKRGDKEEAVKAYQFAADNGLPGARWKLARMYASGDGVKRDDLTAFRMFEDVIREGAAPGSQDESYVADANVAVAHYLQNGIPGTDVGVNLPLARDLYLRAATAYGSAQAQFELGRMLLSENSKGNVKQAVRWLQLAVKKGHNGAQALLGNLYFESGRTVRGLAMMTEALQRSNETDKPWILDMQERAFALSNEADRRTAMALAQDGKAITGNALTDNGQ